MGTLSRLHYGMSSSWDGELATHVDFLATTALAEKMASNQGWNEELVQTRKRGGGMYQLKEVDMLSAKMDMLMKKLED